MQHGEATREEEDSARPLTDRGRDEVLRVARAAKRAGVTVEAVFHSGKLRAQQTADVLADVLRPRAVGQLEALAPKDDPAVAARAIDSLHASTIVVGHLPHLSRLAGLLVTGDMDSEPIAFRMGGIVCLERGEAGWRVKWILTPEVVP